MQLFPLAPDADGQTVLRRLVIFSFGMTACSLLWLPWVILYFVLTSGSIYAIAALVIYLAYIWGPGKKACYRCAWPKWLCRLPMWRMMADYFSASLIKTADLDPKGNYIFCMHPHGVVAVSGWINFCTDATGFSRLFPGIDVFVMTLEQNFMVPLLREYILLHGLRSASRKALQYILTSKPGRSVLLVVGGASEALLAAPGTHDLVLARHKGFVKMALQTGASLVPVYAFGETDLFHTHIPKPGSRMHRIDRFIKRTFGLSTPHFWGTGLTGGWGLICLQRQLTTVVGAPLHVPKCDAPCDSEEFRAQLDKYHKLYVEALQRLWDEHKNAHALCRRRSMTIVE